MRSLQLGVIAALVLLGFQAHAAPTGSWFLIVSKDTNQVLGLNRIRRDSSHVYRLLLGKGRSGGLQVELTQAVYQFPSPGKPGQFKTVQVMTEGDEARLFLYQASRVSRLEQFDACLLRGESGILPFHGLRSLKGILDIQVMGRRPEDLKAAWNRGELIEARKSLETVMTEWEGIFGRLAQIELRTREGCANAAELGAFQQSEPKLSGFKLKDKDWNSEEEDFPLIPVPFLAEYITHWHQNRGALPEYFYAKLFFSGPFGIDSVKVKLTATGEGKYMVPERAAVVDKVQAEFKLGLLSVFAKPVFEFWLGRESPEVLYNGGNPGMGESFESFLLP